MSRRWGCSCGVVCGIPYLSDVRRSITAGPRTEYHGPFYCDAVDVSPTGKVLKRETLWPA